MLYSEIIAVFFSDPHKTHKCTVWAERRYFNVKLVVQLVIAWPYRPKAQWVSIYTTCRNIEEILPSSARVHYVFHTILTASSGFSLHRINRLICIKIDCVLCEVRAKSLSMGKFWRKCCEAWMKSFKISAEVRSSWWCNFVLDFLCPFF